METLRASELGVASDVSLISFDEQPWATLLSPPLTTIAQPVQQMSEKVVDLLFELFENTSNRTTPRRVVLPFFLIERASVRDKTTGRRPLVA
ncbi:MAG: substrate-binding domain-containing protein [Terrimicrobiaceae bacterium]|nr:substrate-binding domain-containing protein [Terrimicrobiaceae bacterium]